VSDGDSYRRRQFEARIFSVSEIRRATSIFNYTTSGGEMTLKRLPRLLLALFLLIGIAGCSDTGIGAGVGAGGGALVGSAVGHPWLGALVGGAGGAVVGHEIGKNKNNGDD
jgi:Glycine zipper